MTAGVGFEVDDVTVFAISVPIIVVDISAAVCLPFWVRTHTPRDSISVRHIVC